MAARDTFRGDQPAEALYVFYHHTDVGRGPNVRVVLKLHRTRTAGGFGFGDFLCRLKRVPGGKARDYHDRICGEHARRKGVYA